MKFKHTFVSVVLSLLLAGLANAEPIEIEIDTGPDGSWIDPSLTCQAAWFGGCDIETDLSDDLNNPFSIGVGETVSIAAFDIRVWAVLASGQVSIEAVLALVNPNAEFAGSGSGAFGSFLGFIVAGALHWDDQPEPLDLGDGTTLQVTFENLAGLTFGGSVNTVHATFSRFSSPVSVPEPGVMGLLGLGLLTIAALGRRRREIKS